MSISRVSFPFVPWFTGQDTMLSPRVLVLDSVYGLQASVCWLYILAPAHVLTYTKALAHVLAVQHTDICDNNHTLNMSLTLYLSNIRRFRIIIFLFTQINSILKMKLRQDVTGHKTLRHDV